MQKGKEVSRIQFLEDQLNNRTLSNTSQAEILNNLGYELYKQTLYKSAIDKHIFIGENYRKLNKFKKGLQYCNQHLEISEQSKNDLEIQRGFCNLGLLYMDQAEYFLERYTFEEFERTIDLSISNLIKSALQINKIIQNRKSQGIQVDHGSKNKYNSMSSLGDVSLLQLQYIYADSLFNQANALFIKGQKDSKYYEQSIEKLKEALKAAKEYQYTTLQGKCYNTMGLIYLNQKKYDSAIKQFLKDADICEKGGDITGLIDTYINIGLSQQGLRQYDKAREYFQKGLNLSKKYAKRELIDRTQEKMKDLKEEESQLIQCKELEKQLRKTSKFDENLSKQYCEILLKLEDYQTLIEFTSGVLKQNQNNLVILTQNAIGLEKAQKYNESKEIYEQMLKIYQSRGNTQTLDYVYCLIEYANVIDELKQPVETIEANYLEAYSISNQLGETYPQKIVLENLDILYEQQKLVKKRKENKKTYLKLLATNPQLKDNSATKSQGDSSSSDSDSLSIDGDDDDDQELEESNKSFKVSQNRNKNVTQEQGRSKNKSKGKVQQNSSKIIEKSRRETNFDNEDDENQNISFRTNKKKKKTTVNEEEDDEENKNQQTENHSEEEDDDDNKQNHQKNKNLLKQNKNFIKPERSPLKQLEQNKEEGMKKGTDLFSVINDPLVNQQEQRQIGNQIRNINDIYKQKCKKYFLEVDQEQLQLLQNRQNIILKKRYYNDTKIVPVIKTIRFISDLQVLNLSHNLLTNKCLKQLNFSKYNKNLQTLNLAFNHFIYDEIFYDLLFDSQSLPMLSNLNLSGLSIAENHQDQIWHQIFDLKQLQVLKFKSSSLTHLPDFLPLKMVNSKLEDIVIKNNQFNEIDKQFSGLLYDIISFREFKRFSYSNQKQGSIES